MDINALPAGGLTALTKAPEGENTSMRLFSLSVTTTLPSPPRPSFQPHQSGLRLSTVRMPARLAGV